jgi:uncharacterized protein
MAVINNKQESRYELNEQGQLAYLQYSRHGARLFINTVQVPGPLENRGVGSLLVKHALEEAKEKQLKVTPFCSFAAHYIKEHPEYRELVPEVEEA